MQRQDIRGLRPTLDAAVGENVSGVKGGFDILEQLCVPGCILGAVDGLGQQPIGQQRVHTHQGRGHFDQFPRVLEFSFGKAPENLNPLRE